MGWDIVSIGQHNLNTSSLENLARDLSERLNINIVFGGFETATYCEEEHTLTVNYYEDFIEFGQFIRNDIDKVYRLVDNSNCYKEILNGLNNLESLTLNLKGNYYSNKTEVLEEIRNSYYSDYVKYELNDFGTKSLNLYEIFSIDVLKDTLLVDIKEPFRWFSFLDIFTKEIDDERKSCFLDYRKQLKNLYTLLGANQIFLFADQGVGEWILDKVWESNWKELNVYIKNKVYYKEVNSAIEFNKKEIEDAIHLNISEFFLNNYSLYSDYKDIIDVCFDDFKDLN